MIKRAVILFDCILIALIFAFCVYAYTRPLNLPYQRPVITANADHFICVKNIPTPPQDMNFTRIYDAEDPERDDVMPAAQKQYAKEKSGLIQFQNEVLEMSNGYFFDNNAVKASCVLEWLNNWADGNALLGDANMGGVVTRQSALAAFSSAYAQIKDEKTLPSEKRKLVEAWLRELANAVISEYPDNAPEMRKNNNLLNWAAWSVALTGVALNDRDLYGWGLCRGREAIEDIQPDGSLRLEIKRGSRALQYHQYALSPLIMLAETGARNGTDLYSLNENALKKLAIFTWSGLQDPAPINKASGKRQINMTHLHNMHFSWIKVYAKHFPNKDMQDWLAAHRPMTSSLMGGNMTELYAP